MNQNKNDGLICLIFMLLFFVPLLLTLMSFLSVPGFSLIYTNTTNIIDSTNIYIPLNTAILAVSFAVLAIIPALSEKLKNYVIKQSKLATYILGWPILSIYLSFILFITCKLGNFVPYYQQIFIITTFFTYGTIFSTLLIFNIIVEASRQPDPPNILFSQCIGKMF